MRGISLPIHIFLADLFHEMFLNISYKIFTCLFQFKNVLNKELLKIFIGIIDAQLFKAKGKKKNRHKDNYNEYLRKQKEEKY